MKAAIYLRISRDKTGEEAGVTRQNEDCVALAKQLGWPVVETYRDNDKSAMKRRPEFERMLAEIDAGLIDAIICWHPDRLYRRVVDLGVLVDVCKRTDVQIATVRAGNIDLSTPTGRLIAGLLAQVATYEGEAKSDRYRRSIRQRREAGQIPVQKGNGPRLFGYNVDGSVNTEEADVVRYVSTLLLEGESQRAVTRALNVQGVPTSRGGEWSTQGLKALMTNPRLAGHSVLNGVVLGVGQWEPILTPEEFEQLQAVLNVRRGHAMPRARVSLLLGVARCGLCGTPLIAGRLSKRPGEAEGRRVYRCPLPPRANGCGKIAINAADLEDYAEGYAEARLADPEIRAELQRLVDSAGASSAEVVALEERLRELEAQLDEPGVPVEAITRAMARTKDRIDALRSTPTEPVVLPSGEWPEDLARRARLVRLALKAVHVDPVLVRGRNAFDSDRVRPEPR